MLIFTIEGRYLKSYSNTEGHGDIITYTVVGSNSYIVYARVHNTKLDFEEWQGKIKAKTTKNSIGNRSNGYEWISEDQSYDSNGNLKEGLYHQAIFFSNNGTYDSNSNYNIGSSIATVYLADGSITTFDACTLPSDTESYPTIPEGEYEAKVGIHRGKSGSYTALRMGDVGTSDFDNNRIELGEENPAFSDGRTYAEGANIHKSGLNGLTGFTSKNDPISAGCLTISRDSWSSFIGIFNSSEQKDNTIGVTVSRTFSAPENKNIPKLPSVQSPKNWKYIR